ncbi:hypothetical protein B0H17DRAFT_1192023 [Mycena rosella]|uniref:Hemerythrin-like domain-containing protein n=1 Tax=Mycena rosella TaxID=1033263 RepID=A0AAD7GXK7_MYCRO|nr:hypothetical protein B0H17DRAFT_1192023 [Mycena rosella]
MPFPYPTIARPAGDWKDPFDNQAIEMSISHNMFIRGMNAIHAQAEGIREDQVKAFAFFCVSFFEMIGQHHKIEEEILFPIYDQKLGAHAMDHNVEQHHAFMDGLHDLETYVKEVHAGTTSYKGSIVIQKLESFADALIEHLHDEIPTLESSRLRAVFTKKDLADMEANLVKIILKDISLFTTLPIGLLCHDKSTAPHFPPMPAPVLFAVKYAFSWRHNDAWQFAPCDIHGNLKPGLGNDTSAPAS